MTEQSTSDTVHPARLEMLADLFAVAYAEDGEGGGEHVSVIVDCAREFTDMSAVNLAKQAGWTRRDWYVEEETEQEDETDD